MSITDDFIVSIGSLNVDINLKVKELAFLDEESSIISQKISSGGCAGNIASGISRLGIKSYFWGNIGCDDHTKMLKEDFDLDNVDYSFAKEIKQPNNTCYSIVDLEGNKSRYAINNVNFKSKELPKEFLNKNCKFVIFTSLTEEKYIDEYINIAKMMKKNKTKVVFAPGNIYSKLGFDKIKKMIQISDFLFINFLEYKQIGVNIEKLNNICKNVIVTRGDNGVDFFEKGNNVKKFKPYKTEDIVDSTGAGDCFVAGAIANYMIFNDIIKAIDFAQKVASRSIQSEGTRNMPKIKFKLPL